MTYHRRPDGTLDEESLAAALEPDRKKARAGALLHTAVKKGLVEKQPCEVCGDLRVHGHREDYEKPLDVIWLCPLHHAELHARKRRIARSLA